MAAPTLAKYNQIQCIMKKFIIINTSEYNNDGYYYVTEFTLKTALDCGLDEEEKKRCGEMEVGDMFASGFFRGAYIMRVV